MREGWQGEDYLILFEESEIVEVTQKYEVAGVLGGYQVVGLMFWDDFILRDNGGSYFTVPTVPLDIKHLAPTRLAIGGAPLVPDDRFKSKIRWHTKPIVFGGHPTSPDNICWITLDQHIQVVIRIILDSRARRCRRRPT
jgi:hypothetical protein